MNRFGQLLLSGLFVLCLFSIGIYTTVMPQNEESDIENRTLAQQPNFLLPDFLSGEYMEDFEAYFTDQFPGRNVWLNTYINYQRLTNKTYIFNYYVSDENWILPKPSYSTPTDEIEVATNKVNDFGEKLEQQGIDLYYFSLPHKVTALDFIYPSYIEQGSYKENLNYFMSLLDEEKVTSVNMLEIYEQFSEQERKQMYFKTDHHWNMNGAFEGYKIVAQTLSETSPAFEGTEGDWNKDSYEKACIPSSKPFMGSYNKQIYASVDSDDNEFMCTFLRPEVFDSYEVSLGDEKVDPYEVYASGLEDYHEKNNIYYGNIFANDLREINITNPEKPEAGNILILKDSYTNPIIYHIAQNFHQTTIYDTRHNQDRTVMDYIDEHDFDVVAILYNNNEITGVNYNFDTLPK